MHHPAATPRPWHSVAWLAWAIAAAGAVQLAPSPVYVALVVGIAWVLVEAHAPDGPYRQAFPILVGLGVVFGLFRVAIAALTTHNGLNVLFTVPHATMPDVLGGFTVGGTVESDIVLQAAAVAFTVIGVMAVFGAVNTIWSHYELVQSTPRSFYELGVVVTVALAYIPATIDSMRAVREADRARTGGKRGAARSHSSLHPAGPRTRHGTRGLTRGVDGLARLRNSRTGTRRRRGRLVCARGPRRVRDRIPRAHRQRHDHRVDLRRSRNRRTRRGSVAEFARRSSAHVPAAPPPRCRLAPDGGASR